MHDRPDPAALLALLRASVAPVARAKRRLGRVEERKGRPGRFRIDFGAAWPSRYLGSFRGVPLESRELAEAVLQYVEAQVANGGALEDVLAEIAPGAAEASAIEPLLARWLEAFGRRVETGKRQPGTLRSYKRWAGPADEEASHFRWWYGKTLRDVSPAAVEEWDYQLARDGLGPKSRRNVLSGFHSFLRWVREQRPGYVVPSFSWPEVDERQPRILTPELQWKVLFKIPWPEAGAFYCMALTLVRPGEVRVLRVRDWDPATNEIRVSRAAKDHRVGGVVRGLKSRNAKTVPANEFPLHDWLEEHVTPERRLRDPDGPLFPNRKGGWWSPWSLAHTWKQAADRVGVRCSLYEGTKHSTATHLKALGADDRVLAALAGHRDPRSVAFYAKLDTTMIRSALERLRRQN